MYRDLWARFRFRDRAEEFMSQHRFADNTVYAMHVRTGNGEKDFTDEGGRGMSTNLQTWVENVGAVLHAYSQKRRDKRPPLIFLATDTQTVTKMLINATSDFGIPVVFFPQEWVPSGKGVSYSIKAGDSKCMRGWESQVMDMMLLGMGDVVIAGQYSSFSQAVPLSMALVPKLSLKEYQEEPRRINELTGKQFCEIGIKGNVMQCFQDFLGWAQRKTPISLVLAPSKSSTASGPSNETSSPTRSGGPSSPTFYKCTQNAKYGSNSVPAGDRLSDTKN